MICDPAATARAPSGRIGETRSRPVDRDRRHVAGEVVADRGGHRGRGLGAGMGPRGTLGHRPAGAPRDRRLHRAVDTHPRNDEARRPARRGGSPHARTRLRGRCGNHRRHRPVRGQSGPGARRPGQPGHPAGPGLAPGPADQPAGRADRRGRQRRRDEGAGKRLGHRLRRVHRREHRGIDADHPRPRPGAHLLLHQGRPAVHPVGPRGRRRTRGAPRGGGPGPHVGHARR